MAYGLQTTGGTWWDSNSSFDTPVTPDTITSDIATQSQYVETSGSNDGWTDWFKGVAGNLLDYSIKKDAALTGVELQRAAVVQPQQPVYMSQASSAAPVISMNMLLLIAAGVGVYMLAGQGK